MPDDTGSSIYGEEEGSAPREEPSGPPAASSSGENVSSRPASLMQGLAERLGPRRSGELPWESGDAYLLGQVGRAGFLVALTSLVVYLLSPVDVIHVGEVLRVGQSAEGTAVFEVIVLLAAVLLVLVGLTVARSRQWLTRTMILQTDIPWEEMAALAQQALKESHASGGKVPLPGAWGLLVGAALQVRPDYAPLRVVGSRLGYVSWGGARSIFAVPLPLFRHPKWGQEVDLVARAALGWERPTRVKTPVATSIDP